MKMHHLPSVLLTPPDVVHRQDIQMHAARLSLIEELVRGDDHAWRESCAEYRPLISRWLGRNQLQQADIEDLTHEVMCVVVRRL